MALCNKTFVILIALLLSLTSHAQLRKKKALVHFGVGYIAMSFAYRLYHPLSQRHDGILVNKKKKKVETKHWRVLYKAVWSH